MGAFVAPLALALLSSFWEHSRSDWAMPLLSQPHAGRFVESLHL